MKTIIWDVDDVLNDLMREWFEDWEASSGENRSLRFEQLTCNPPHGILGIGRSEYLASLDDFRLSGKAGKMQPLAEVLEWFCRYGDRAHHAALTATPLYAGHVSAEWVMRNFGRWVRSFNVIPSPRPGIEAARYHATKRDFLAWLGKGDVLIDDNEENVAGAASLGIRGLLFPRPWNRSKMSVKQVLDELTEIVFADLIPICVQDPTEKHY